MTLEEKRVAELKAAQIKAEGIFHEVVSRGLIRSGISEEELNAEIYALAREMYGISTYWHKRIVRAGKNTLLPYGDNPPDLIIGTKTSSSLISVQFLRNGRQISVVLL
jgi:Xaa-Pro dipeptidase